jgi:hypothetical protein
MADITGKNLIIFCQSNEAEQGAPEAEKKYTCKIYICESNHFDKLYEEVKSDKDDGKNVILFSKYNGDNTSSVVALKTDLIPTDTQFNKLVNTLNATETSIENVKQILNKIDGSSLGKSSEEEAEEEAEEENFGGNAKRANSWAKCAGEYYRAHKKEFSSFSDVLKSNKFKAYYKNKTAKKPTKHRVSKRKSMNKKRK